MLPMPTSEIRWTQKKEKKKKPLSVKFRRSSAVETITKENYVT